MSPRTESSNQKIRDERREQILYAALKVFATRGLKATKISDIASEAKISQGLVHHYYPNKDDVFIAVIERALTGMQEAFDETAGQAAVNGHLPGSWQRLERLTGRMIEGLQRHPEYLLVVIQCLISQDTPPQTGMLIAKNSQALFTNLAGLIREGQAVGEVTAGDPEELALAFIATIQGLVITQFTQGLFTLGPGREFKLPAGATLLRMLKA